jgi:hypothetical protein
LALNFPPQSAITKSCKVKTVAVVTDTKSISRMSVAFRITGLQSVLMSTSFFCALLSTGGFAPTMETQVDDDSHCFRFKASCVSSSSLITTFMSRFAAV